MGTSSSRQKPEASNASQAVVPDNTPSTSAPSCPVVPSEKSRAVYNVYNQRIDEAAAACPVPGSVLGKAGLDPRNNMPLNPNQQPYPGQRKALSISRLESSIPKGNTTGTWLYPSPQMFYNALKRKNKGDDVTEEDMGAVVHAHNTMNELTWQHVLQWESLHRSECGDPRLLRFLGRPDDLSPMARLSSLFGGPLPFDRHDWYVDRCGQEVRYVIDFYFDEDLAGKPEAFSVRARPAVDSLEAVIDRTKMNIYTTFARYGLPCPISGHPSSLAEREQRSDSQQPG